VGRDPLRRDPLRRDPLRRDPLRRDPGTAIRGLPFGFHQVRHLEASAAAPKPRRRKT
jgi:hypothetical protein